MTLYARQQKRHKCKEQTFGVWKKARVGFERQHWNMCYYHMWNKSPVQVRCMRQGTQGRSTGTILRDGMGREVGRQFRIWRTHVHPWLIHVNRLLECGRRQGWDLRDSIETCVITICEINRQSRFDAWDRALRAGPLGRSWGMGWGGRWEDSLGYGGHMYTHGWFMWVYGKKH